MDTKKLTKQLNLHEWLRLKPYLCTAGKLTKQEVQMASCKPKRPKPKK